jgi:transposase
MAQNFLSCDREQVMLLPPSLSEWLPEGHLARFVVEVVGELDLDGVYGYYRADGHGRRAHDPAMMTALLLYNYAVGVRSSRAIERRCVEDVACRVIAANRMPDHATIARFRVRHERELSELFFQVLGLCREAGMVKVGTVAIDSTKLAANASLEANRTHEGLRQEARRILREAGEVDAREDELYGERRGDELPEELADPSRRAGRIRELLAQARAREDAVYARRRAMHERQAERLARRGKRPGGRPPGPEPSREELQALKGNKYNLTDPDSGIVRHRGMLIQGYNIHTVVSEGQVILAARATGSGADQGQLASAVEDARRSLERIGVSEPIAEVVADTGYWDLKQVRALQDNGARVLVPPPKPVLRTQPEARQMNAILAERDGHTAYRRRQQIVEPVFAHWKHIRGITRVLTRGKHAVQAEIDLVATTHNLLKLYRHTASTA